MKVGEFRRIASHFANDVLWAVTLDDENFIDINAAAVQNLQVKTLLYLRKNNTMVLYVRKPEPTLETGLVNEIAYRLNVGRSELIEACKAVGIDLEETQRIRDEKRKKAEAGGFIKEQIREAAKSGSLLGAREFEYQMEQLVKEYQQPQQSA